MMQIYNDWTQQRFLLEKLYGNFALVIGKPGEVRVYNDPQGIYPIWHDTDYTTLSSSFPLLCEQLSEPEINQQAVYQQIFQEATFGGETVFKSVRRIQVAQGFKLQTQSGHAIPDLSSTTSIQSARHPSDLYNRAEQQDWVHMLHGALAAQFGSISACFGQQIDSALSAGYDSRLLLALCLEQQITPQLHVYGDDRSSDVQIAKTICDGEKLRLAHNNKTAYPRITPGQFEHVVNANFYAFQGSCADGILDNGADLDTRRKRSRHGGLLLNGGGGEVMRNFFYLSDRRYRMRELLWSFFSRFDRRTTTSHFDPSAYYRHLENHIAELLGDSHPILSRHRIEYLYARFRCTYWMGQNNAINNQFGWFLTPFVDASIAALTYNIPIKLKNHGRLQGALIKQISPRLAAYMSDYGHHFHSAPPLQRRLKDFTTIYRPPLLRKYLYRWKKQPRTWPYYLSKPYIDTILPQGFHYMPAYFQLDKIKDPQQFSRICSLEYLFQHCNAA